VHPEKFSKVGVYVRKRAISINTMKQNEYSWVRPSWQCY